MSLASDIIARATQTGKTVTTAESCTGGMVAAALTDIAGSSAAFERGFVTYSNRAKSEMLGVSPATLDAFGAVSEEVAREMARGALQSAGADVAVAISGIAGPGGSSVQKPVGLVHLGIAGPDGCVASAERFGDRRGRAAVQQLAVIRSLDRLRLRLLSES